MATNLRSNDTIQVRIPQAGGVDGQVGATGKIVFTASRAYFCTDGEKCVIADSSGWKTVTISE